MQNSDVIDASGTLIAQRWRLVRPIGRGAAASVYVATDEQNGEQRAVKVLDASMSQDFGYRSRFISEAKAMWRMQHPNIAKVFAYGEDSSSLFTVMEFAPGGTVLDTLNSGERFRTMPALSLIFQILQAVSVAHREGIIHRDIKPSNILIGSDGKVRLTDFGIARYLDDSVPHRTVSGASMGTLGYMAPEQGKSARHVGKSVDLYAAGATLYVMLARKNPISLSGADANPEILLRLPLAVRLLISKACSFSVEGRYQTARQMAVDVAKTRDVIAGTRGQPRVADEWMERFDELSALPWRVGNAPELI